MLIRCRPRWDLGTMPGQGDRSGRVEQSLRWWAAPSFPPEQLPATTTRYRRAGWIPRPSQRMRPDRADVREALGDLHTPPRGVPRVRLGRSPFGRALLRDLLSTAARAPLRAP